MKITIEHEGSTVTIEDNGVLGIGEAIYLVKRALIGVGFHPESIAEYLEGEE